MVLRRAAIAGLIAVASGSWALAAPDPLFTDPPHDPRNPARMEVVRIPSHGVRINGVFYLAAGAGPHRTLIFFHGQPGNEQNLDLAQGMRRLGWNVLTLHYRGAWGGAGTYSYTHLMEDGLSALAFVRDSRTVRAYGIDSGRVVLAGHSTGGLVAVNTASRSGPVAGLVLISASDDPQEAFDAQGRPKQWRDFMKDEFDDLDGLSGCTPDGLARELLTHGRSWTFRHAAPTIKTIPTLIVTADDGLAAEGNRLGHAIEAGGGRTPTYVHFNTDHPYSDRRIALQKAVAAWLTAHVR